MKYVKWISFVLLTSIFTSFIGKDSHRRGLEVGNLAPDIRVSAQTGEDVFLSDLRGEYVLLSFWASYDAPSRMNNAGISHILDAASGTDMQMVSISFDEYQSVFQETERLDNLRADYCFTETKGESSAIFRKYDLEHGFSNYLIDKDGVIVAKGLSVGQLAAYLQ